MSDRFNAAWLMEQVFPPTAYVVPGIIPEGMTLLVAAPKIGKSWLVLGLSLQLANGGVAFGRINIGQPRPVLYLALEDSKSRLQGRLLSLNGTLVPERLEFITTLESDESVIRTIAAFMQEHLGEDPVVVLDTLGKVMPAASGRDSAYSHDYKMLSVLKSTTDAVPGSSLIIVHHTRKAEGGDFLDAVSGTQGIAGAADTVLVLKRERHDKRATLQVTSRDAQEGEYSLTFSDSGHWTLDGDSLAAAANAATAARVTAGLGDKSTEVINKVGEFPEGITPGRLKELLPHLKPGTIDNYLKRAVEAERIWKTGRGSYTPIRTVRSASFETGSYTSNTSYTPASDAEVEIKRGGICPVCNLASDPPNASHGYVHPGCELSEVRAVSR